MMTLYNPSGRTSTVHLFLQRKGQSAHASYGPGARQPAWKPGSFQGTVWEGFPLYLVNGIVVALNTVILP